IIINSLNKVGKMSEMVYFFSEIKYTI
ncbi:hypothetical protein AZK26_05800, partial [Streptococcus pneumoniae]